jgi:hypothetical protein
MYTRLTIKAIFLVFSTWGKNVKTIPFQVKAEWITDYKGKIRSGKQRGSNGLKSIFNLENSTLTISCSYAFKKAKA